MASSRGPKRFKKKNVRVRNVAQNVKLSKRSKESVREKAAAAAAATAATERKQTLPSHDPRQHVSSCALVFPPSIGPKQEWGRGRGAQSGRNATLTPVEGGGAAQNEMKSGNEMAKGAN